MSNIFRMASVNQMLIMKALNYYGTNEMKAGKLNPIVDRMLDLHRDKNIDDNWAWCGAFMAYLISECSLSYSTSLSARHYLKIGDVVQKPIVGDLVIFWRESPDSWKGHVGLYIGMNGDEILTLGGNQNNQVNITGYHSNKLLGFRRL